MVGEGLKEGLQSCSERSVCTDGLQGDLCMHNSTRSIQRVCSIEMSTGRDKANELNNTQN